MTLTVEQVKKIIDVYPFLLPRNVWTGETIDDYDYTWLVGVDEVPEGWQRLFLLYCKNLRPYLVKYDALDKFGFSQVKEKYGTMRLYDFGKPASAHHLETKYEAYSKNICQRCGRPSELESLGWTGYFCANCLSEVPVVRSIHVPSKTVRVTRLSRDGAASEVYTLKHLDREYKKAIRMSKEEFVNYIVTV